MNAFNLSLSSCTQCNVLWFYCMRVEKRRERGKLKQIIVFAVETSKRSDMKLNAQKKRHPVGRIKWASGWMGEII